MSKDLQTLILQKIINDDEFAALAMPHLKPEYFSNTEQKVFMIINEFFVKYLKLPTISSLRIEIQNNKKLDDESRLSALDKLKILSENPDVSREWLNLQAENWCRERAVTLAIVESMDILEGNSKDKSDNMIPEILQNALSITFDNSIGHDYLVDFEHRYEFYHDAQEHIPFDIDLLNKITNGGLVRKTLSVIMAGTGVGKSFTMCHMAAAHLLQGKNVLYITMEMAEERIAERIDANLMNTDVKMIPAIERNVFISKMQRLQSKTVGKMIVKEYPTASAHVGHFRALLNDLSVKKKFKPDIVYIDYLNICA